MKWGNNDDKTRDVFDASIPIRSKITHEGFQSEEKREEEDEDDRGRLGHGVQGHGHELEAPLREPDVEGRGHGDPRDPLEVDAPCEGDPGLGGVAGVDGADDGGEGELHHQVAQHDRDRVLVVLERNERCTKNV